MSAEFRVQTDTEFSFLGEQIVDYVEAKQLVVGDLMIEQFDKVLPVDKRVYAVNIFNQAVQPRRA